MRLLLDECMPKALGRELPGHDDIDDLRPLIPEVIEVLKAIQPGQVVRVGA